MIRASSKLATVILLLSSTIAQAENYQARYEIDFSGIKVGSILLNVRENEQNYAANTVIETKGLARLFKKFKATTQVNGTIIDGAYVPKHYQSGYSLKEKPRSISFSRDTTGAIKHLEVTPKDTDRPEVKLADTKNALDPLSAFFTAIDKQQQNEWQIPVFDGKRLMLLHSKPITEGGDSSWSRIAQQGYTGKELKRMQEREQSATVTFSNKPHGLPKLLQVPAFLGMVNIGLKSYTVSE